MMNRRYFLFISALSALAVVDVLAESRHHIDRKHLAANLRHLLDPAFKDFAETTNAESLVTLLVEKGVIDSGNDINTSLIRKSARVERAVEYKGFFYDPLELQVYGLAYLLNREDGL